ncbi:TetR family transcriptional regulator [Anderseniella sp. Alg231-50]|uniref:TetR family transcriptional regulator n=1 Tax=Anderseniella sp. Alg231-50 TaxID=1922226 RepID=UPI000D554F51
MTRKNVTPLLQRNDPDSEPLTGNTKVTRQDWLNVAMDILISDGVEQVKVLTVGERLNVSRSSFYWYFKSRQDLLNALLQHWDETNTAALVHQSETPADTITGAICNVFRCFVDDSLFNTWLDFAIRDWARRSGSVRRVLDQSDETRLAALEAMFARYDYPAAEALTRARVLYYMQIGYNLAELNEPMSQRLKMVPHYLHAFTGLQPAPGEVEALRDYATAVSRGEKS